MNPYKPGEAYDLAQKALKDGNILEAQRLCEFMVESDMKLTLRRIAEKQRETAKESR